ncbi:hypothetical protein ACVQKW_08455 [Edwardsiella tarda]|uniref:excisionase n=1 Tax=Edwardsiella tarda TaxID=636 RepID=UPI000BE29413|nr:excisionase [Edwardsiella tarda]ATI63071.1 excisionase [Edwardsiella tarda]UBU95205.1 hypothetical protein AAW15_16705 [Edwardsiella tarda]UCQ16718.1 hypothetical protein DCF79_10175 [Edwardsiella tarda]
MNQIKADPIRAAVLSVNDFCQWAGIGRTAFYTELKARRLVARKFGWRTIVPMSEAEK